jgi:hypothetical protein
MEESVPYSWRYIYRTCQRCWGLLKQANSFDNRSLRSPWLLLVASLLVVEKRQLEEAGTTDVAAATAIAVVAVLEGRGQGSKDQERLHSSFPCCFVVVVMVVVVVVVVVVVAVLILIETSLFLFPLLTDNGRDSDSS